MNYQKLMEEELREAACYGDVSGLEELIQRHVNINSKNYINGWTALHWAACRNNVKAVSILLNNGADPASLTYNGDLPVNLTTSEEIQKLLGGQTVNNQQEALPITPNYLKNPEFFYSLKSSCKKDSVSQSKSNSNEELTVKVRVADALETDFIEVELPRSELTFEKLQEICCKELNIKPFTVLKIRKLPDTIIRNNRDVQKLTDFQELEICVKKHVLQVSFD